MPCNQDYLYMLQTCIAFGALIAVFMVFRYQTIDNYADNRKEVLRIIVDIKNKPIQAEWIQDIGKKNNFDDRLLKSFEPAGEKCLPRDCELTVKKFINEINRLRTVRQKLTKWGILSTALWGFMAVIYLFAQIFNWYDPLSYYKILMSAFLVPLPFSAIFFKSALSKLH